MSNKLCVMTPELISKWAQVIKSYLIQGRDIFIVGDTETTGKSELGDKKNFGRKDRVLEIGFLLYIEQEDQTIAPLLDEDGAHIYFHEYINPFLEDEFILERYNSIREIPEEVIKYVHGIDLDFLNGNKGMVMRNGSRHSFKLKSPAPTFSQVKPYIEMMFNLLDLNQWKGKLKFIAHNALFDVQFMNAEWHKSELLDEKAQYPCHFEGFIHTICTLSLMQSLYSRSELSSEAERRGIKGKAGFSLDFLQIFYDIQIERDMHGALLDSKILAEVYNAMILDDKFQNSYKTLNKRKIGYKKSSFRPQTLPVF